MHKRLTSMCSVVPSQSKPTGIFQLFSVTPPVDYPSDRKVGNLLPACDCSQSQTGRAPRQRALKRTHGAFFPQLFAIR